MREVTGYDPDYTYPSRARSPSAACHSRMSPGSKVPSMSGPTSTDLNGRRRVLVADEDSKVVAFIHATLHQDGFVVFHAYDGLSASDLAFAMDKLDLVITNTRVSGMPGIALVHLLRGRLPNLPILYIADIDRSTPAIEERLPRNVPILREPFTAEQLRELVNSLLDGRQDISLGAGG